MSSIWITLLDTSGSMGDGFSATQAGAAQDPLAEHGAWATKIEAAKELLLKQIGTIRVPDLAVFEFKHRATKIFQGTRDQLLARPGVIQSLKAGGGTSIAAAIAAVESEPSFEQYRSLNVLIVSDGLSDVTAAKAAAESLLKKYPFARIDTILIDDTNEGRMIAEVISINGSFRPVTSSIQLRNAISSARQASLQANLSNMALLRLQTQRELASLDRLPEPTLISVVSGQRLTAETLRDDLVPTLLGLEAIGKASSRVKRREYDGSVSSISQDSPISINLTGLKDAVELALTYVIPWRRKNAETIAAIEIQKKELEVKRERQGLEFHEFDLERRRLEIDRQHLELSNSRLELAQKMMKAIDSDFTIRAEERERIVMRLLSGVEYLSSTRMEFRVVNEDSPRIQ